MVLVCGMCEFKSVLQDGFVFSGIVFAETLNVLILLAVETFAFACIYQHIGLVTILTCPNWTFPQTPLWVNQSDNPSHLSQNFLDVLSWFIVCSSCETLVII